MNEEAWIQESFIGKNDVKQPVMEGQGLRDAHLEWHLAVLGGRSIPREHSQLLGLLSLKRG